ncbi:unnamed protein product [Paramecium pentaurelia]|uniref:Cystinosin n=1 Tax=Paramecium pentaurelia TaxID=43138 RepID=A0A8S1SQD2_9CILI|nr:unnamed protein product [Paramecium pentaurelia]
MTFLQALSTLIGWTYFAVWSISFYPQIYENWRLKNVNGLSVDYVGLNITGYICLCIYSTAGYLDKSLDVGTIHLEDLAFAYHGLFCTLIIIGQMIFYPLGDNKLSKFIIAILVILWTLTPIYFLLTQTFDVIDVSVNYNAYRIIGYDKLLISFIKYIPQVYWNYKRKKTIGWNIWVSLLDITGGILSVIQTIMDQFIYDDNNEINPVKFALGLLTIGFDSILIFQHYFLYPPKKDTQVMDYVTMKDNGLDDI